MTNIRPLLFLLLAVSIVGSVACGTNEPAVTPTITVQVVSQIFPSISTPSVPTPTAISTMAPTPTIFPIPSSGAFVSKWGREGTGDGEFYAPVRVAVALDVTGYNVDGTTASRGSHQVLSR